MQGTTFHNRALHNRATSALLAVYYLLAVLLPALPLLPSTTSGAADGSIVICTWNGTKLFNMADGSQKDLPNPASQAPHCPLCLLPQSQQAALLPAAPSVAAPYTVAAVGYDSVDYALATSPRHRSVQPRAPPHPLV